MSSIPAVHIPAHSLTPDEWTQVIEAYATNPDVQESILRAFRTLSQPGATFTPEQKAQIAAMADEDARRAILDLLNTAE